MNLLQSIINYYHGEARHGFWGAVLGAVFLIGGLAMMKWASPLSLLKGSSLPMLLFGLMVGIGGGIDGIYTSRSTPGKIALYQQDPASFLKQEKLKVEKTHQGWHGIRIFWAALGFSGLVLSLLIRKPYWIGAGLGTLALTLVISAFEFYSMRFNDRYYHTIQSATIKEQDNKTQQAPADLQRPAVIQQKSTDLPDPSQINTKPAADNKPQKIHIFDTLQLEPAAVDSLQHLKAAGISPFVVKNSAAENVPGSLQLQSNNT